MKALTLWEPFASAIALGIKTVETRGWATNYTGPIAIHAAMMKHDRRQNWDIAYYWNRMFEEDLSVFAVAAYQSWQDLPFGCVVATARLECCTSTNQLAMGTRVDEREYRWGNYQEGRYGWLLADVKRLERPIPARGMQRLWEWNAEGVTL